ncbi:MAG: response regulator [Acidobacteria bacterium]|nr:response regulator [Acidobacteriota bacterium]
MAGDRIRVLMVDDEELIRRLAAGMARRMNVEMVAVGTAAEAVEAVRTQTFDVLVADMLLGEGADGIALARQVAALQPDIHVVLMSGYSASHFDLNGLPGSPQFLDKPFSSESLARCLSLARNRRSAGAD